MKIRTVFILIGLAFIAAFIALNWNVMMIPTSLYFGVATVNAPLGFMMLVILTTITTLFLALFLYTKSAWSSNDHKNLETLLTADKLVSQTESTQISELQTLVRKGLKQQTEILTNSTAALMMRLEQIEKNINTAVKQ